MIALSGISIQNQIYESSNSLVDISENDCRDVALLRLYKGSG